MYLKGIPVLTGAAQAVILKDMKKHAWRKSGRPQLCCPSTNHGRMTRVNNNKSRDSSL